MSRGLGEGGGGGGGVVGAQKSVLSAAYQKQQSFAAIGFHGPLLTRLTNFVPH